MNKKKLLIIIIIIILIGFIFPINFFLSQKIEIKNSTEIIWNMYDTNNIPLWDEDVEYMKLNDNFKLNATGKIKIKNGPDFNYTIVEYTYNKSWTSQFNNFGIKINFIHELNRINDSTTEVLHTIHVNRLIPGIIFCLTHKNKLAKSLNNLKKLLE